MSCNGCRVLRKGCSETCVLRSCLQWIDTPQAQGHATLFVAKFFGRAGLMSFISAVPESQRAALFRSLLYEACGRTVNPINGAVGLLWTGNWHVCQAAVDTVLRGGNLQPMQTLLNGEISPSEETYSNLSKLKLNHNFRLANSRSKVSQKRKRSNDQVSSTNTDGLDLGLTTNQTDTVSMNSEEESVTTNATLLESGGITKLLNLFV